MVISSFLDESDVMLGPGRQRRCGDLREEMEVLARKFGGGGERTLDVVVDLGGWDVGIKA